MNVIMFDTARFEGVSQIELWVMESNAFMKSIVTVHILSLHFVAFLSNRSVRRKMVCCLL